MEQYNYNFCNPRHVCVRQREGRWEKEEGERGRGEGEEGEKKETE
jgi:hypothetical protein